MRANKGRCASTSKEFLLVTSTSKEFLLVRKEFSLALVTWCATGAGAPVVLVRNS